MHTYLLLALNRTFAGVKMPQLAKIFSQPEIEAILKEAGATE
jgi:hypothetical protein